MNHAAAFSVTISQLRDDVTSATRLTWLFIRIRYTTGTA